MYVTALLISIFFAYYIIKKDNHNIPKSLFDSYIIWVEIGLILGAKIGYVLFYDPNLSYFSTSPWQIFNPFDENGEFVGIAGFSYHGALLGFFIASALFSLVYKIDHWYLLDIVAVAAPLGYIFGRVGNFLNQELIGKETSYSWGIYVDGVLRHPSQLYEAFLEGVVVFAILYLYRGRKSFNGELISLYMLLYAIARFVAEFFREPDPQIGYLWGDWMTRGQEFSIYMMIFAIALYLYRKKIGETTL